MPRKVKTDANPPDAAAPGTADASPTTPEFKPLPAGPADPPESAIGTRIQFARKQLGLSVEALARYSVNFDGQERRGISATSLLRYESGENDPGAREIRILCDAFSASPRWLIYGQLDNAGADVVEQALVQALQNFVRAQANELRFENGGSLRDLLKLSDAQRREWLDAAKKPASK